MADETGRSRIYQPGEPVPLPQRGPAGNYTMPPEIDPDEAEMRQAGLAGGLAPDEIDDFVATHMPTFKRQVQQWTGGGMAPAPTAPALAQPATSLISDSEVNDALGTLRTLRGEKSPDYAALTDAAWARYNAQNPAEAQPALPSKTRRGFAAGSDIATGLGQIYAGFHPESVRQPLGKGGAYQELEDRTMAEQERWKQGERARKLVGAQMIPSEVGRELTAAHQSRADKIDAAEAVLKAYAERAKATGGTKVTGALRAQMQEEAARIRAAGGTDQDVSQHFQSNYGLTPEQADSWSLISKSGARKFEGALAESGARTSLMTARAAGEQMSNDYRTENQLSEQTYAKLVDLASENLAKGYKQFGSDAEVESALRAEMDRILGKMPKQPPRGGAAPAEAPPEEEPLLSYDGQTDLRTLPNSSGLMMIKAIRAGEATEDDKADFVAWAQFKGYTNASDFETAAIDTLKAIRGDTTNGTAQTQ